MNFIDEKMLMAMRLRGFRLRKKHMLSLKKI